MIRCFLAEAGEMSNADSVDAKGLKSKRVTSMRRPRRGSYDYASVAAIPDKSFLCHVGFSIDGQPYVIPTSFGRAGKVLYVHGSAMSRMLRRLSDGVSICITCMLLDGIVLARSLFNHSINYRSVVVLGSATSVEGDEKLRGLEVITEHIVPGRWADARKPTPAELAATTVLKIEITEASAKIRSGPPLDDGADYALPCWARILPVAARIGGPVAEARVSTETPPDYILQLVAETNG
jgi:uncharacterized protein